MYPPRTNCARWGINQGVLLGVRASILWICILAGIRQYNKPELMLYYPVGLDIVAARDSPKMEKRNQLNINSNEQLGIINIFRLASPMVSCSAPCHCFVSLAVPGLFTG